MKPNKTDYRKASADRSHRTLKEIQDGPPAPKQGRPLPQSHARGPSTLPSMSERELEEAKRQLREYFRDTQP